MAFGFYINNKNCYGCKTCVIACKSEKQLEKDVLLRSVTKIMQDSPQAVSFLSMACNHCEEPACLSNCPVGAYEKLENGIVKQNHELCIGCKTCIQVCPYDAPSYDEQEGKTHKCDMCSDRQAQGLMPACVSACPGVNLAVDEMSSLQSNFESDIISDAAVETKPNFVITKDPKLSESPEASVVGSSEITMSA